MKIINREVKACENTDWTFTNVLEINYSHKWETGKILIRDYNPELEKEYLKELRKQVSNLYVQEKMKA